MGLQGFEPRFAGLEPAAVAGEELSLSPLARLNYSPMNYNEISSRTI
jgi:hypothetical protein